jgi:hypothetical protein
MLLAVLHPSPYTYGSTLSADEIFRLEVTWILISCGQTVLHSSEVRALAFETLEVG